MKKFFHLATFFFTLASIAFLHAASIRVDSLTHEFVMDAGSSQEGTLTIVNTSEEAVDVEINHHDYIPQLYGRTEQPELGVNPRSNGPWISLSLNEITIAPKSTGHVKYQITPPEDAKEGSYWSAFTIVPKIKLNPEDANTRVGLFQRTGYIVQVISRIGTEINPNFKILKIQPENKEQNSTPYTYMLNIENDGISDVALSSYLELYSTDGELVARSIGSKKRVYPDTQVTFYFRLKEPLAKGEYDSLFVLDDGDENYFGVQRKLQVSENGNQEFIQIDQDKTT